MSFIYLSMTSKQLYNEISKDLTLLDTLSQEVLNRLTRNHIQKLFLLYPEKIISLGLYNRMCNNFKINCLITDFNRYSLLITDTWRFYTRDWWKLFINLDLKSFKIIYKTKQTKLDEFTSCMEIALGNLDIRLFHYLKSTQLYYLIIKCDLFTFIYVYKFYKKISAYHWLELCKLDKKYCFYANLDYFSELQLEELKQIQNSSL